MGRSFVFGRNQRGERGAFTTNKKVRIKEEKIKESIRETELGGHLTGETKNLGT